MMRRVVAPVLALLFMGNLTLAAASHEPLATSRILVEKTTDGVDVTGIVYGHANAVATATLTVKKISASGSVSSHQTSQINISVGSETQVARMSFGNASSEDVQAELSVFVGGNEVHKSAVDMKRHSK